MAHGLEELRMLTNAEMDSRSALCCLLVGQPTLRRRVKLSSFAALDQRIALRYAMAPMTAEETASYIEHHLKLAGRSDTLFSDDAVAMIHSVSRGLPQSGEQPRDPGAGRDLRARQEHRRRAGSPPSRRRGRSRMTDPPPGQLSLEADQPTPAETGALHDAPRPRRAGRNRPRPTPSTAVRRDRRQVAPHTEADPVAILTQLLIGAGSVIGRGAFFQVEATRHHPNEYLVLVGDTAKSRKGSSFDHVARLLAEVDPSFPARITTGLSTGEGVVWAVRDPTEQDPGAADKRLLVVEPEFASVLKQTMRDINTLSPVLRSAWDGRPLQLLTRTAPARATDTHISVIGHITAPELRRYATTIEITNGLLNRFSDQLRQPRAAAARRRQTRPAPPHRVARYLTAALAARPLRRTAPLRPPPGSCGGTHTPRSPNPSPGSPGISPPAPRRTPSASRSSTRCSTAPPTSSPSTSSRARALGLRRPLRSLGARQTRPATHSPNRSTPR